MYKVNYDNLESDYLALIQELKLQQPLSSSSVHDPEQPSDVEEISKLIVMLKGLKAGLSMPKVLIGIGAKLLNLSSSKP